jgi:predicted homoserine dehydrogenase-like protein
VAVAKRDLAAGETVDGIGGNMVYGVAESADAAATGERVPLGLARGARVLHDVAAGTSLSRTDLQIDDTSTIAMLRRLQDRLLSGQRVDLPAAGLAVLPVTASASAA